jgi:hypothetical protein
MSTIADAQEALAHIHASRAQLARVTHCPPARHIAFAALMASVVLSPLAAPYQLLAMLPIFIGMALVIRWDRRRMGMFVNGYRRGRTRWVIAGLLPAFVVLYLASMTFALRKEAIWPSLLLGAVMFGVAWGGSILWQRVFVRELEASL